MELKKIYLDNAATTPMDNAVIDEMVVVMKEQFGNPSSIHSFGRKTRALIEVSRRKIASLLNATPGEIFFTSGGTEADNMALRCSVHDLGVTHIITSAIEHHAVLHTAEMLEKEGKVKLSLVKLDQLGRIDYDHLESLLTSSGKHLVSLMHANNEIGNLIDVERIGHLCEKYQAIFHTDTVQTMGHYPMDVRKMKAHFITGAAHKFHGPKGVGFLFISHEISIKPMIFGGAQERNMRGGTENVYGIIGLSKALEIALNQVDEHNNYVQSLKSYMIQQLEEKIPGVEFNGDAKGPSLYTVLNVRLPHTNKAEMLLYSLDIAGIACSGGSACSSGSNVGSHVLRGIGVDMTRPSIRFSFSRFNTKDEIDYTINQLVEIYSK
jgi:cysteine desulfurase